MTDYYILSEIRCKGLKQGALHDFHSERGKGALNLMHEVLGKTRKVEERMATRTYRYKVLETIEENDTYE